MENLDFHNKNSSQNEEWCNSYCAAQEAAKK